MWGARLACRDVILRVPDLPRSLHHSPNLPLLHHFTNRDPRYKNQGQAKIRIAGASPILPSNLLPQIDPFHRRGCLHAERT